MVGPEPINTYVQTHSCIRPVGVRAHELVEVVVRKAHGYPTMHDHHDPGTHIGSSGLKQAGNLPDLKLHKQSLTFAKL